MTRTRILLADDHILLTDVLINLLAKSFEIVGVARDGREMIQKTTAEHPDVVIADVMMPVLGGIEAARTIHREAPRSKLLFLTMHHEISFVQEVLHAGALGYVLKTSTASELVNAIRCVAKGCRYVSHTIDMHLLSRVESRLLRGLTPRRCQIVQMIAEGLSMKEVGVRLGISTRTAETHKYVIMRMLGVSTTASLIRYAIRTNLVQET